MGKIRSTDQREKKKKHKVSHETQTQNYSDTKEMLFSGCKMNASCLHMDDPKEKSLLGNKVSSNSDLVLLWTWNWKSKLWLGFAINKVCPFYSDSFRCLFKLFYYTLKVQNQKWLVWFQWYLISALKWELPWVVATTVSRDGQFKKSVICCVSMSTGNIIRCRFTKGK